MRLSMGRRRGRRRRNSAPIFQPPRRCRRPRGRESSRPSSPASCRESLEEAAVSVAVHVAKRAARCFAGADGSRNDAAPRRVTGGMMKLRSVTLVAAVAFAVQVPTISLAAGFSMKAPSSQNSISRRIVRRQDGTRCPDERGPAHRRAAAGRHRDLAARREAQARHDGHGRREPQRSDVRCAAGRRAARARERLEARQRFAGERGFYRSNNPDFYPQHNGPG